MKQLKFVNGFLGFRVDQNTGVITTSTALDREMTASYFLTLIAQDCSLTEPRAAAVNLTIDVLDENDNSPVFAFGKYEVSSDEMDPLSAQLFFTNKQICRKP